MNGNNAVLSALFAELDALGVHEFCVCAGARNAPIIDSLVRRGAFIRHFFDERSAAFFALGRVMKSRKPVAVVTTSGTAVAELLPAMIEAYYQILPLVVITADRPSRYWGSGAPQAIEQTGLFGCYVHGRMELEFCVDGERNPLREDVSITGGQHAMSLRDGPMHINVRLEEGLAVGTEDQIPLAAINERRLSMQRGSQDAITQVERETWRNFLESDVTLVVLASGIHPADVSDVCKFLLKLGAPVVAEATANLPDDSNLRRLMLRGGEQALKGLHTRRVLRIGAVPSWRWWRDLDARDDLQVLCVSRAPFRGLARTANVTVLPWEVLSIAGVGSRKSDSDSSENGGELDHVLDNHPNSEPAWMRHVSRIIGSGAVVFLGNSLPIREWNLAAAVPKSGTAFFANRGANGIDGLLSTWLGVSADAGEAWLIVGDLSAMYDMNAPWILSQLPAAKRRIVVINNGGGNIFSHVSWLNSMPSDAKRVMENPHAFSFEPWARMWGMDYRLITEPRDLLDDDSPCAVWEIRPDAAQTEAFWSAWR